LAGLLLLVGCGGGRLPAGDAGPGTGQISLQVVSHHQRDVAIYLYRDGTRERLGLAGANQTVNFFIPWRKIAGDGAVQFQGDPVGGRDLVRTDLIRVQPGQVVIWTLGPRLSGENVAVY